MWLQPLSTHSPGFMGTGAALMRRDGGVEGLILEKVNGLPLDKRCGLADTVMSYLEAYQTLAVSAYHACAK